MINRLWKSIYFKIKFKIYQIKQHRKMRINGWVQDKKTGDWSAYIGSPPQWYIDNEKEINKK